MSWLFSRVLVEEYLEGRSLDGEQFVRLKSILMPQAYCANDKMTAFFRLSRFGMTYAPLMESLGGELLMWYREGFRVRTSVVRGGERELMESKADCGGRWPESFTIYDRDSHSWRTHQCSLFGGLEKFSGTWPRWGMMRNGACSERMMSELPISEKGSGYWRTPHASDGEGGIMEMRSGTAGHYKLRDQVQEKNKQFWPTPQSRDGAHNESGFSNQRSLPKEVKIFPTPTVNDSKNNAPPSQAKRNTPPLNSVIGGALNPTWVEWLMGWPLGWTDLKPLATDRFRQWQHSHGISCTEELKRGYEYPMSILQRKRF